MQTKTPSSDSSSRPLLEQHPAGWHDPIPGADLSEQEKRANRRDAYLRAELEAFGR